MQHFDKLNCQSKNNQTNKIVQKNHNLQDNLNFQINFHYFYKYGIVKLKYTCILNFGNLIHLNMHSLRNKNLVSFQSQNNIYKNIINPKFKNINSKLFYYNNRIFRFDIHLDLICYNSMKKFLQMFHNLMDTFKNYNERN